MNSLSIDGKKKLYKKAKIAYYDTDTALMSDAEFDRLEDEIRKADPKWVGLKKTGAFVGKKSAVVLAEPMASLDKVKPENPKASSLLDGISKRYPGYGFGVSPKLDGASIQSVYQHGKLVSLATRGDGTKGKDISHFISHVSLPKKIPFKGYLVLRHEAVLNKKIFEKKYSSEFDSARAVASGVFNRHNLHPAMKDVHLPVLRVLNMDSCHLSLTEGWDLAKKLGFEVVPYKWFSDVPSITYLTALLAKQRQTSLFELDGLVVASDKPGLLLSAEKPDWAKAFKVDDYAEAPTTTITDIVWKASSFGVLVPKAVVDPVMFGNVTVRNVAVHNPKMAVEKGYGIGAVVRIIRSGDIIPKIIEVVKPAKFKLPDPKKVGDYEWDETRTNIVLVGDSSETKTQTLKRMFVNLDMNFCGPGLAAQLVEAGIDSPRKVMALTELKLKSKNIAGLGPSKQKALIEAISNIRKGTATLDKLAVASGAFTKGVGTTRVRTLQSLHPELLKIEAWDTKAAELESVEVIATTKGLGPAFASTFAKGAKRFIQFLEATGTQVARPVKKVQKSGKLTGINVSFTGYRSREQEADIESFGGEVVPFGSRTTVLLFDPNGKASSKVEKAKGKGVKVLTWSKFREEFLKY